MHLLGRYITDDYFFFIVNNSKLLNKTARLTL